MTMLLSTAKAAAEDFCLRTFPDKSTRKHPEAVRLAILLYASHFYTNRENNELVAYQAMTQAFQALLWPYRDLQKLL